MTPGSSATDQSKGAVGSSVSEETSTRYLGHCCAFFVQPLKPTCGVKTFSAVPDRLHYLGMSMSPQVVLAAHPNSFVLSLRQVEWYTMFLLSTMYPSSILTCLVVISVCRTCTSYLCVPRCFLSNRSAPETTLELEGAQEQKAASHGGDGGHGTSTIAAPGNGGDPVGRPSEEGLSAGPPSAKEFCFVKAILHLPDEDSRPSVSNSSLHSIIGGVVFFHAQSPNVFTLYLLA